MDNNSLKFWNRKRLVDFLISKFEKKCSIKNVAAGQRISKSPGKKNPMKLNESISRNLRNWFDHSISRVFVFWPGFFLIFWSKVRMWKILICKWNYFETHLTGCKLILTDFDYMPRDNIYIAGYIKKIYMWLQFWREKKIKHFYTDISIFSRLVDQEGFRLFTSNPRRMQRLPKKQWMTKKLMEDVFESIFLLRKEHILPLQGVIWADLLSKYIKITVYYVL